MAIQWTYDRTNPKVVLLPNGKRSLGPRPFESRELHEAKYIMGRININSTRLKSFTSDREATEDLVKQDYDVVERLGIQDGSLKVGIAIQQ